MLEVDGGINRDTAQDAIAAGADVLVAGTAVFDKGGKGAHTMPAIASPPRMPRPDDTLPPAGRRCSQALFCGVAARTPRALPPRAVRPPRDPAAPNLAYRTP